MASNCLKYQNTQQSATSSSPPLSNHCHNPLCLNTQSALESDLLFTIPWSQDAPHSKSKAWALLALPLRNEAREKKWSPESGCLDTKCDFRMNQLVFDFHRPDSFSIKQRCWDLTTGFYSAPNTSKRCSKNARKVKE